MPESKHDPEGINGSSKLPNNQIYIIFQVPIIIEMLIEEILEKQPQTNLHQFAAAYFSQPKFDLYKKIQHRLEDKVN